MSPYIVAVLYNGYSTITGNKTKANCTCTLIKGLKRHGLKPDDIHYVICTHGHSDHVGNNNLFTKAKHIVGYSVSVGDTYEYFGFDKGNEYVIDQDIKVIPTPGHTTQDVTVIVKVNNKTIAITGDLFEKEEDIKDPKIWIAAGSENEALQSKNRDKILNTCDVIVPGHGPMFRVTEEIRVVNIQNKNLKK